MLTSRNIIGSGLEHAPIVLKVDLYIAVTLCATPFRLLELTDRMSSYLNVWPTCYEMSVHTRGPSANRFAPGG